MLAVAVGAERTSDARSSAKSPIDASRGVGGGIDVLRSLVFGFCTRRVGPLTAVWVWRESKSIVSEKMVFLQDIFLLCSANLSFSVEQGGRGVCCGGDGGDGASACLCCGRFAAHRLSLARNKLRMSGALRARVGDESPRLRAIELDAGRTSTPRVNASAPLERFYSSRVGASLARVPHKSDSASGGRLDEVELQTSLGDLQVWRATKSGRLSSHSDVVDAPRRCLGRGARRWRRLVLRRRLNKRKRRFGARRAVGHKNDVCWHL